MRLLQILMFLCDRSSPPRNFRRNRHTHRSPKNSHQGSQYTFFRFF